MKCISQNASGAVLSLFILLAVAVNALADNPSSITNYQGAKISLNGPTNLAGPLTYQWYFNPTPTKSNIYSVMPGATNSTLAFDPALVVQTGSYYAVASNLVAGVTSAPVALQILFAKTWGYLATDPPFILSNAVAIAVGNALSPTEPAFSSGHYLALRADGKISPWGPSFAGETNVAALSNSIVTAVAAGNEDSLALKSDGSLYAWGLNTSGQTNVPAAASDVIAIACGDTHDLALRPDGTVVGWGQNTYLQASNSAATNVVAIAAGGQNSFALRADGSMTVWGLSSKGSIPAAATNVIAIACGLQHFLVLRANGTVVGWGDNTYGQTSVPAAATNVVAISTSANHNVALRNDGTVVTWGSTYPYVISNAVAPSDLTNVVAIASGGEHDVALFGTRAPVITVQPWNRTVTVTKLTSPNILLAAKCAGAQPVRYQWQLNGTNVSGATNDTLSLGGMTAPGGPIPIRTGAYQLIASNAYGVAVSKYAKIATTYSLGDALDATNLTWITSGSTPWFGETNLSHDGLDAARSGGIGGSQETILQTTLITNAAGRVTFWWKVSSEQFFDILEFRLNGTVQASISGEVNWQQMSIPVAAGTNVLMWRYSKDASFDGGQDAGWVDQFAFTPPPPVINTQPTNQTVFAGATATFSVSASGSGTLSYHWQKNGVNISNNGNYPPTTATLTLLNVQSSDAASYTVVVSNVNGSVTSSPAMLTVLATPPVITSGPAGRMNNAGTTAAFFVGATGSAPFSYRWQKNGVTLTDGGNVSGSTTIGLVLSNVQDADVAGYAAVVSNAYGSVTSAPALLGVVDIAPIITSQPVNYASMPGTTAAFSVTATGSTPIGYQWQFNGTSLAGAVSATLTLNNIGTSNAGPYQVVVTNGYGAVTSSIAILTLTHTRILAWGDNTYGQTNVPAGLPDVTAIAAGFQHDLALGFDGSVLTWGRGDAGETTLPPSLAGVTAIAGGDDWSLALKADGTVAGWGAYGNDLQVGSLSNVTTIAAGWFQWLAIKADGSVATWDASGDTSVIPPSVTNVVAVAAGVESSIALKADGTVVVWGLNNFGEGNVPAGLSNVIAVAASSGSGQFLALKNDGTVVGWGSDSSGQIDVPPGLSNVVAIATGQEHSLALKADGTMVAWGANGVSYVSYGQTNIPAGLSNVVAIAAGGFYSMALVNDGSPAIVRQPVNQTVANSTTVQFSVTALGAPSLNYQWQKNGVNLTDGGNVSGSTAASLTLSNVQTSDMAVYAVVITNAFNSVTSAPATLVVSGVPAILAQPLCQTVNGGMNVQFSVAAIGSPTPTYQWWQNGTNQVGGNSPMLILNGVGRAQDGTYTVVVTNALGGVISSNATLKVLVAQQLGAPALLPDGSLQLTSSDVNGGTLSSSDLPNFEAQASTDLVHWMTLSNALSLTNGGLQLQDGTRTNYTTRFYRIIEH